MGDLGLLRNPPSGWLEAVAVVIRSVGAATWTQEGEGGAPGVETSSRLAVTWEVRVPGRAPYVVENDERKVPTWTIETQVGGTGKRWYKVRLKRTYGLMPGVGVPCRVNPKDPLDLWIDWDAAYRNHEVAWDRKAALDRAVADQRGGFDKVVGRLANPFGVAPTDADRAEAAEVLAAEEAELAVQKAAAVEAAAGATWAGVDKDEKAVFDAMAAELQRIHATGRQVTGRVVAVVPTGRTLVGVEVKRIEVEIQDLSGPRVVALELPLQKGPAKRVAVGKEISVWLDPGDENRIAIA
ncbi:MULTISPECIES: hypothetical protein [unclassified Nocardioides]|uniref:hypothetical protein n=1 Tax=unclassified Nocardioides TaxID=2615069 RepID=UPI0006FA826B|nr:MULTISPECIES: hypothetical protein [unclassified Nocardioides]KRA38866.1 hypothetical protein ASD81_09825 [Nocardioides sp. Root614]KRA92826.1 hypothetical protein ASD84_10090 [Nocardioides sp. Root682]